MDNRNSMSTKVLKRNLEQCGNKTCAFHRAVTRFKRVTALWNAWIQRTAYCTPIQRTAYCTCPLHICRVKTLSSWSLSIFIGEEFENLFAQHSNSSIRMSIFPSCHDVICLETSLHISTPFLIILSCCSRTVRKIISLSDFMALWLRRRISSDMSAKWWPFSPSSGYYEQQQLSSINSASPTADHTGNSNNSFPSTVSPSLWQIILTATTLFHRQYQTSLQHSWLVLSRVAPKAFIILLASGKLSDIVSSAFAGL